MIYRIFSKKTTIFLTSCVKVININIKALPEYLNPIQFPPNTVANFCALWRKMNLI